MLEHDKYINLKTFKRDLSTVETPVWWISLESDSNTFYAFTNRLSGKVKRIRNNSTVQLCPCDFKGKPLGDWIDASAFLSEEHRLLSQVVAACKKKYSWSMHLLEFASTIFNRKKDRVVVKIILKK
jgi:PPOX class probable F420-dependent enzyme|tara:strand:+ start:4451 stop:4828 length:378 start_codon:yes stop_codon:yes gene_type:complete